MRPGTPMNEGTPCAARIISSAMASSWSVVTPGLTSVATRSSTDATSAPAIAILSIWALLLSVTRRSGAMSLALQARRLGDGVQQRVSHVGHLARTVNRAEHAAIGVVVDDLVQRRQLLLEPRLDGLWLVVVALVQRRTIDVAYALDRGRARYG